MVDSLKFPNEHKIKYINWESQPLRLEITVSSFLISSRPQFSLQSPSKMFHV